MQFLYQLFNSVESEQQFNEVLNISLTDKEQEMVRERWRILNELRKGHSQRKVAETLGCSVVTVTRGAKVYRNNQQKIDHYLSLISA